MENDSWKQVRSDGKGPDSTEAGSEHDAAFAPETGPGAGEERTDDSESRDPQEDGAQEPAAEKPLEEPVPYMELFYSEGETIDCPADPAAEEAVSASADEQDEQCEPEAGDLPELWMKHMASEPDPEPEEEPMDDEQLSRVIEDICRSKAEEFRMIGYEQVTGEEIWECVSDKYRKTGVPPLHRIVNDILSLKATQFMNWMTMSIYKDAHR